MTERPFNGVRDRFYIQVLDPERNIVVNHNHGHTFPSPADLERALITATGIYGHGVQVKVDKRFELNYLDGGKQ